MTRKEFNLEAATGNIVGNTIQMNFKKLSMVAVCSGFNEMSTTQKARECFIGDILTILSDVSNMTLYKQAHDQLSQVICEVFHDISLPPSTGEKATRANSKCVAIGKKAYVFHCEAEAPYWWGKDEYGKAMKLPETRHRFPSKSPEILTLPTPDFKTIEECQEYYENKFEAFRGHLRDILSRMSRHFYAG